MLSLEETSQNVASESGCCKALAYLTEGIYGYLQEVDGYRAVCRRHEGTAMAHAHDGELEVTRFFESGSNAAAHLQSALRQLPHWEESPCRRSGGRGRYQHPLRLVPCGIVWEERRLLVRARHLRSPPLVQVDLVVPSRESDFPELPLKRLADALRCHEFLIPGVIAHSLPPPSGHGTQLLGIREYLSRAMPPNLYASQCI